MVYYHIWVYKMSTCSNPEVLLKTELVHSQNFQLNHSDWGLSDGIPSYPHFFAASIAKEDAFMVGLAAGDSALD